MHINCYAPFCVRGHVINGIGDLADHPRGLVKTLRIQWP